MSQPKLHHYVPQFHLRRFVNRQGRFWVWDKTADKIFSTGPNRIAAERNFYSLAGLISPNEDAMTMERQFSELEHQASVITSQWISWLDDLPDGERIELPEVNRELMSQYITLQFLRTADTRDILSLLADTSSIPKELSDEDRRNLHTTLLWDQSTVDRIKNHVHDSIWVFGRNPTSTPFLTSDNPVAFRSSDNAMWLKVGYLSNGTYVVFPLTPRFILYCYPKEPPWKRLAQYDGCLSPVRFTTEMVVSENSGQVFMASRFIISQLNNFADEREFAKTIGTDS